MAVQVIPDCEAIIIPYLYNHPDLVALDARVASQLPATFTRPWVKATQLNARNHPSSPAEHLITYSMQFDCYAGSTGGQAEANLLSRTVRAVLHALPQATVSGAVVSRVTFTTHMRLPDDSFEPARERYVIDAEVTLHA